jgi:hypothetical protein
MLKPKPRSFVVTVKNLRGVVSNKELKNYIQDAVEYWGGQFHPDDPLFDLYGKVRVVQLRQRKEPSSAGGAK